MTSSTLTPPRRLPRLPAGDWTTAVLAGGIATALALIAIAAGWRGSDLPAQLFRVELFRRHGFVLWDSQWFSGHPTLDYSVLSPMLGALVGPLALGAASGAVSAVLFDRLVRHEFGTAGRVGSLWFAFSTVANLLVGRVTFALGAMFALGALLALQRGRVKIAWVCGLLCGLASPVAGLFLAIAAGALGLARRPTRSAAWITCATALAPMLVIAKIFPSPGGEPYEWWALGCDLALCAVCLVSVPERFRVLRYGAAVYAVVLVAAKLVSSPLGGNVSRLNQYAAGPLLACALWEHRRSLVFLLAIPLLVWQSFPTIDSIAFATNDPSTHSAYYQPLLGYLSAHPPGFGRVEIPTTFRHWESAYVAPKIALARGWERQLDIAYNKQFYDGSLTASTYRSWLAGNAVEYVALPDAKLDSSATLEAAIIRRDPAYLTPVWHGAHWQVWRFTGYHGLVDGAAQLAALTPDGFTLRVARAGTVVVHMHDSPHWAVRGAGCTTSSPGGWTEIQHLEPGSVRVVQALRGTRCDADQ